MRQARRLPPAGTPRDRGAVAVEFALMLPLLLMLVSGMIDFGRALNAQISISHAAREGVRASALGVDDIGSVVRATATSAVAVSSVQVTRCPSSGPGDTTVVVRADVPYVTPIAAFVPGLGTGVTLTGTGVARCFA
jgi:Flp pilus assembly protein TadG